MAAPPLVVRVNACGVVKPSRYRRPMLQLFRVAFGNEINSVTMYNRESFLFYTASD
jgi:hypothetical protein